LISKDKFGGNGTVWHTAIPRVCCEAFLNRDIFSREWLAGLSNDAGAATVPAW